MSLFNITDFSLLLFTILSTSIWTVKLTRQISNAPDLHNKSAVKGTALLAKRGTPILLFFVLACYLVWAFMKVRSSYLMFALFILLIAFYIIIYLVSRDRIAAERSRFSSGKSTWRGKRALRWARESVVAMGLLYVLLLSLLLAA